MLEDISPKLRKFKILRTFCPTRRREGFWTTLFQPSKGWCPVQRYRDRECLRWWCWRSRNKWRADFLMIQSIRWMPFTLCKRMEFGVGCKLKGGFACSKGFLSFILDYWDSLNMSLIASIPLGSIFSALVSQAVAGQVRLKCTRPYGWLWMGLHPSYRKVDWESVLSNSDLLPVWWFCPQSLPPWTSTVFSTGSLACFPSTMLRQTLVDI